MHTRALQRGGAPVPNETCRWVALAAPGGQLSAIEMMFQRLEGPEMLLGPAAGPKKRRLG